MILVFKGWSEPPPLLLLLPLFYFSPVPPTLFSSFSTISSNFLNKIFTILANRPLFNKSCKDDTYGLKKHGERTTDIL